MKNVKKLLVREARRLLEYDPTDGSLWWRERDPSMFRNIGRPAVWNARAWNVKYAGKKAGAKAINGYLYVSIRKKQHLAHRLVWLIVRGKWPPYGIDHINGDRSDNRIGNLRSATHLENVQNQKKYSNNSSGYQGVSWNKRLAKWDARISHNKQQYFIGYFKTAEDAFSAYLLAKKKYHPFNPIPQGLSVAAGSR